jgi:hypothetical protein
MKHLIAIILSMTGFCAYSQPDSIMQTLKHIDSVLIAASNQQIIELNECDSVALIDADKVYKCFNYFFRDSSKKDVYKVSISFNGFGEELCFYYENNKVIKAQRNKGMYEKYYSADYLDKDKVIFSKKPKTNRKELAIGTTLKPAEEAYYFRDLAFEYVRKSKR